MLASVSVFVHMVARISLRVCKCMSALSVRKHDLMQHGIPNTSGALSIFFLARTSCSPERFRPIHDIYEAPMSPGARCPDNWDSFSAMTTKRQILSRPNVSGPLPTWQLKLSVRKSKAKFKQKLVPVDKKKKHKARQSNIIYIAHFITGKLSRFYIKVHTATSDARQY